LKNKILLFFLLGTLAMTFLMAALGKTLKTAQTPNGITDIEFAQNEAQLKTVITAWSAPLASGKTNIEVAKTQTQWDFLYILFYAGFFFLTNRSLSNSEVGFNKKLLKISAIAGLLSGIFDVIENYHFLKSLNGQITSEIAAITSWAAKIKFSLIAISLLTILFFSLKRYLIQLFKK
jgi:hypothetical protein